jgi:hypothetical protein
MEETIAGTGKGNKNEQKEIKTKRREGDACGAGTCRGDIYINI